MRLQYWEANGVRVLDDCYNANEDSMRAALETLCELPLQGRRVAVLGDMAELGCRRIGACGHWPARGGTEDRPVVHGGEKLHRHRPGGP